MKSVESKNFELEFVKFYPHIQLEYELTPIETLIYGYVTGVINFQKSKGNQGICFTSSEKIAQNVNCKTQTVNNAIKRLKDKGLIETRNSYVKNIKRRYRYIYLPGEAPTSKNDPLDILFKNYPNIKDNPSSRNIIGDVIHHYGKDFNFIINYCREFCGLNAVIDTEDLRGIYNILNSKGVEHKQLNKELICNECVQEYSFIGECDCDLPF